MERLTQPDMIYGAEAVDVEAATGLQGPTAPLTHVGSWPTRDAFGRTLAEETDLIDYLWQVPRPIRPYVRLDYEAIAEDMCQAGGMAIVETPDGIQVYQRPRK